MLCSKRYRKIAGGYIWKANTDTKNIQVGNLNERLVEVAQYSLDGELLAVFPSLKALPKKLMAMKE